MMIEPTMQASDTVTGAETRSTIYQALALAWRYPDREAFNAYQSGQYFEELLDFASSLPHLAKLVKREARTGAKIRDELSDVPFEAFEVSYVAIFDVGYPEPPCPPYEGLHNKKMPRCDVMLEVSEFYNHFGLKMNQDEDKRELPDYLCAELEFMAFLAFKEAQAAYEGNNELLNGYRWAQRDFLERHMIDWLPVFSSKLDEEEALFFFPHLARFTIDYSKAEYSLVKSLVNTGTQSSTNDQDSIEQAEVEAVQ